MADGEFETVEIEYSEDDILYYLVDEDDNEVGFVIEEDGREVECYYEEYDSGEFELADENAAAEETVEMEVSEEDILYYLVDEDDNEIGFVVMEGDDEVECYYEHALTAKAERYVAEKAEEHGYLHKIASIAGHEGGKARNKAEMALDQVRDKTEVHVSKAKKTALEQKDKAKAKADELDLGITREGVSEATSNLNVIAKEGAETAKELKEAYDDIMDSFGFLVPKKVRRRLP